MKDLIPTGVWDSLRSNHRLFHEQEHGSLAVAFFRITVSFTNRQELNYDTRLAIHDHRLLALFKLPSCNGLLAGLPCMLRVMGAET